MQLRSKHYTVTIRRDIDGQGLVHVCLRKSWWSPGSRQVSSAVLVDLTVDVRGPEQDRSPVSELTGLRVAVGSLADELGRLERSAGGGNDRPIGAH